MAAANFSRRRVLQSTVLGGLGLGLPDVLSLHSRLHAAENQPAGWGRAKACIVMFSWGGMSHLESWDPKPEAPREVRGDHQAIATATSGIFVGEGLPRLARQSGKLAILRGASHLARDHRQAAYLTFTGRAPLGLNGMMVADPVAPTRDDPPCLGAMISKLASPGKDCPGSVYLPYSIAERGPVAGQNAGFLGPPFDPLVVRPVSGAPYAGISPLATMPRLSLADGLDRERLHAREQLLAGLEQQAGVLPAHAPVAAYLQSQRAALDMLSSDRLAKALDISDESPEIRASYGEHVCGQSALLARRLTEAGVPLVTVFCAAGDLNGSFGAHWDHHFQIFPRLKDELMPPLDQASAALLDDLATRGTLDQTLVIWLTEFGRSPAINPLAGRDHWPDCYAVALAGTGVTGGVVHGRSDRLAGKPEERSCGPEDLHATVLHALGIDPRQEITDPAGRPHVLSTGRPLSVFSA